MDILLKYILVDDNEIDRLAVESEAAKFPFLKKIASCSHPLEACELMDRFHPEVLFLDIEMPDISGIDLLRQKTPSNSLPVFVTSHPEFAVDSYELQAFDFLVKPVSPERFGKCALRLLDFYKMREKAFEMEKQEELESIVVKQGHDKHKILFQDILFMEAMKDYTRIRSQTRQWLLLGTMMSMLERLPARKFIRVHRSYIINLEKITAIKGNQIHISSFEIPIGRLYKKVVRDLF